MGKIKIGDVFAMETANGMAYLHYVLDGKTDGDLIRVLPGLYKEEPADISTAVKQPELFLLFFPLKSAFNRNLVSQVFYFPVQNFEKPKFMRTKHIIGQSFLGWHIVNTDTNHRQLVTELSEQQKKLSPWGIWNDTLLKERLENNWTLESWI